MSLLPNHATRKRKKHITKGVISYTCIYIYIFFLLNAEMSLHFISLRSIKKDALSRLTDCAGNRCHALRRSARDFSDTVCQRSPIHTNIGLASTYRNRLIALTNFPQCLSDDRHQTQKSINQWLDCRKRDMQRADTKIPQLLIGSQPDRLSTPVTRQNHPSISSFRVDTSGKRPVGSRIGGY